MLAAVQDFHDKHHFRNNDREELTYRVALIGEELGELSPCMSKCKSKGSLSKEVSDLLVLLLIPLSLLDST